MSPTLAVYVDGVNDHRLLLRLATEHLHDHSGAHAARENLPKGPGKRPCSRLVGLRATDARCAVRWSPLQTLQHPFSRCWLPSPLKRLPRSRSIPSDQFSRSDRVRSLKGAESKRKLIANAFNNRALAIRCLSIQNIRTTAHCELCKHTQTRDRGAAALLLRQESGLRK